MIQLVIANSSQFIAGESYFVLSIPSELIILRTSWAVSFGIYLTPIENIHTYGGPETL
jgi:hypothetical protein